MTVPLQGQRVIITGAAQGLGAAIARYFSERGARLVLMDYDGAGLATTVSTCGAGARGIEVDLSDAAATDAAIADAMVDGPVDTLIHNAAILIPKPFEDEDFAGFRRTLDVGLQAGFQLAKAVWPGMVAKGGGALIFVSSRSGIQGFGDEAAYCAAKHGLEGFSKSLGDAGAGKGIVSSTITPGMYMHTPMSERNYPPDLKSKWVDPILLAPAFAEIATTRNPAFNGQRLDAWKLSEEVRARG